MPLTRSNVTAASRVMLPTYPLFAAAVGVGWLATPTERLRATPGLAFIDTWIPLKVCACGFLLVACVLVWALSSHDRSRYLWALSVMCVWMVMWTVALAWAAVVSDASPTGWTWPLFVAVACWASMVSLLARET